MIKLSANYTKTNNNFVLQNLNNKQVKNEYLPAICVLQNLLQRGTPTLMSDFLISKLGAIHKEKEFQNRYGLISTAEPKWKSTIKGDERTGDNPAHKFFYEIVPKYLQDYLFIRQLMLPEAKIDEITQQDGERFRDRTVDFYLPQAHLVIEIDGEQHENPANGAIDNERDKFLNSLEITTIRINAKDIRNETKDLEKKVAEIKEQLKRYDALKFYKEKRSNPLIKKRVVAKKLLPTAIIRFQLTILKLIECGDLKLGSDWNIYVCNRDVSDYSGYEDLAVEDLLIWLKPLLALQGIDLPEQKYEIKKVDSFKDIKEKSVIKIDFSLLSRWTDENEDQKDVIFVRTDYYDRYPRLTEERQNGRNERVLIRDAVNYFKVNTLPKPIKYNLDEEKAEEQLKFFLKNLFGYDKFNEGQVKIIVNAMGLKNTLGLLPTGGGKSLCYQMAALLQPSISFVVCPLKSLMRDQIADLNDPFYIDRVSFVSSDQSATEKEFTQNNFSKGKYFFIIISPERFQIKTFREYFQKVCSEKSIAYAVIDEVHCLSEWGHDFRPSYLNLADTIKRHASKKYVYIGLTATASLNVKKDIQVELGIEDSGVKTVKDFTRPNLTFEVIDDGGQKERRLADKLSQMKRDGSFEDNVKQQKCGIIFTPYASRQAALVHRLNHNLGFGQTDLRRIHLFNSTIDDEDKKKTQDDFKKDKFPLLVATKAFGMGMNKTNIRYTIHYGIPASMEALYQEAGRAGRDGGPANNYVLLSKETAEEEELRKVFNAASNYEVVEEIQRTAHQEKRTHDVYKQLYLWIKNNNKIDDAANLIMRMFAVIDSSDGPFVIIKRGSFFNVIDKDSRGSVERAIYQMKQLGILIYWKLYDFSNGIFTFEKSEYNIQTISDSLLLYIKKYEKDFTFDRYPFIEDSNTEPIEKRIRILLHWSYDHFSYFRRQSLKGVYELSCDLADNKINTKTFKERLETYFRMTEETSIFQKIVEDQVFNYKLWFGLFYKNGNFINDEVLLTELRSEIVRFLESNREDVGLNLVSGLIRLSLDDYDDTDGRNRLENALSKIVTDCPEDIKKHIFDELLKIAKNLRSEQLVDSVCKSYKSRNELLTLYNELGSETALKYYLKSINNQLININKKIYGKLKLR